MTNDEQTNNRMTKSEGCCVASDFNLQPSNLHHSSDLKLLMRLIEKCVNEGREDEAERIFDAAGVISFVSGDEALRWGMVAEMLGKTSTACRAYKNAVEDSGTAPEAFMRLGQICLERGSIEKAESFFTEAGRRGLPPVMEQEIIHDRQSTVSPEPDFVPLPLRDIRTQQASDQFLQLFRGRQGMYARQWYDRSKNISGYAPIHSLFTHDVVKKHLSGAFTVGIYPLTDENTVFFSALDIDVRKSCLSQMKEDTAFKKKLDGKIKKLITGINQWSLSKKLTVVFEDSGYKGVHAWYFFEKAVPAAFAVDILNSCVGSLTEIPEEIKIEFFPRQAASRGKGYGNLIKLPLGIHRRSGRKSVFLDQYGNPADDQIKHLRSITKNSTAVLDSLYEIWLSDRQQKKVSHIFVKQNAESAPSGKSKADSGGELGDKCAMIAYLTNKASEHHHLSFAERKVLLGVFGHMENGKKVLHDVISRCSDYSPQITDHYISRLKGTPLGCRKIGRMLFYLDGSIPCECSFPPGQWEYPTPLLHLNSQKTDAADPAAGRDDLKHEICMLKNEIAELKKTVLQKLG